ncbi:MAG: hypothetical protein M3R15_25350 [Acidobacteriota bacterium]|nr:hypothetical protein [Acidobacteriota bacterium]
MRWKLLVITSLVTAIVGAGASLAMIYWLLGPTRNMQTPSTPLFGTLLIPIAAITAASIFVYRHTSRRRALQAAATTLLAATLTLGAFMVATIFLK